MRTWALAIGSLLLAFPCIASAQDPPAPSEPQAAATAYEPQTARDPLVPVDQLELMVKPLTKDELALEAGQWLALVKAKVKEIADLEISVKRKNEQIASVERLREAAEEASRALKEAEQKARSGEADQEELREIRERAEKASQEAKEAGAVATGSKALESTARRAEEAAQAKEQVKSALLENLTELREERTALIDRANVVLEELAAKGGDVDLQRKYLKAVSGIEVQVSDTSAAWTAVTGWLASSEGGLRYARNLAMCVATIAGAWLLAWLAARFVRRTVSAAKGITDLMREFLAKSVRGAILIMGIVMGLSMLEINVSPLLAAIGGGALVVAFALQGTLSNFASGILILAYHPFDVGDDVTAAGVSGKVRSMNLLSTQIVTPDNRLMTVPNNQIWGSVITNAAVADTRRVDLSIDIVPGVDAGRVQAVVEEVVRKHELVLSDPEPVVKVHEIGHLATKLICRPWTKTENYWKVYWDITRAASEALTQQFPRGPGARQ